MFHMRHCLTNISFKINLTNMHRNILNKQVISVVAPLHTSSIDMKGHSKWQNIKDVKGKNDMLKSQKTNYILRKVKAAVKEGGFDLKINRKLGDLQQEFRAAGLSLDTFNGFLKKLKEKPEVTVYFDIIGPSGTMFILECETDNAKRTENGLRKHLNKLGGFRIVTDSLKNRFEEKGVLTISEKDKNGKILPLDVVEETAIEYDIEEVEEIDGEGIKQYNLYCDKKDLSSIESKLGASNFVLENTEIKLMPLHPIAVLEDDMVKVEKFYEALMEEDDVKNIYDNVEQN
uniref:Transcriptional regulatory protein n=1 Tax=Parastrongyloides trichosuri TaxID=131310 RepID=A0A0N4ZG38_PARTI